MPDALVVIQGYDPSWPERYAAESLRLAKALERWIAGPIEHIGSTAVPGLAAKPVIDIMVAVESLDASRPAIRTHHLHLVPIGSEAWTRSLAFRDYLSANPTVAGEYATLKMALAKRHRFDREAYTDAKGPFIEGILQAAQSIGQK